MPLASPYLPHMQLPGRARLPFTLEPLGSIWDELAKSDPALPRIGPTVWYRPAAGRRQVVLLHSPASGELRVEVRWFLRGQTYRHETYLGRDVYAAVNAANAAFESLFDAGYRIYGAGAPMLSECFGFRTAWLKGPLFSVKSALALIDYHEQRRAEQLAVAINERASVEAHGLVPAHSTPPAPRSRPSALALQRAGV